jgi:hypothetical protein
MNIEEYLFDVYKSNTKMYKKIYYHKNLKEKRERSKKYYHDKMAKSLSGDFKIIKNQYIIKFN